MNFQPLSLSWFGKHEVRTLHSAEWQGGQPLLQGTALLCGFYLNELLLNLMVRDDPHEQLFDYYQQTLQRLAHGADHASTLRCFEKHLLQELGYALLLEREAGSGKPIDPGMILSLCGRARRGARHGGCGRQACRYPARPCWTWRPTTTAMRSSARQSKQLMRMLLNHHLGGKMLHTRELIKDLTKL